MTENKPLVARRIYTHVLDVEQFGTRKDGTKYEKFAVMFPEDVRSAVEGLREQLHQRTKNSEPLDGWEVEQAVRNWFPVFQGENNAR